MKNLENDIYRDNGQISDEEFKAVSASLGVKLPHTYSELIKKHNGACLDKNDSFSFFDNKRRFIEDTHYFCFVDFLKIRENMDICLEQSTDDPNNQDRFKFYKYFSELLIPFGENGGGDYICFDYRKDPNTDDPPVVFWYHDVAEQEDRTSFIANNFEEFINMLHECEDDI